MTFKFSLVSDLHVDHPQPSIAKDSLEKFIVVAGDTANGLLGTKMLNKWKRRGHDVFAVDGNHEHYGNLNQGRTPRETTQQFYDLLGQHENPRQLTDDLWITGCNGWYPVSVSGPWQNYMNDSRYSTLSGAEASALARADAWRLRQSLATIEGAKGRAIVVTHTAPCLDTLNPAYDGHFSNEWYWNPEMLSIIRMFSHVIAVWCHGHTHAPADKMVNGVRVVCNPRGYPGENPSWAPLSLQV